MAPVWNEMEQSAHVCQCPVTWPMIVHSFWIILQHCGCNDPKDCDAGQRFKSRNVEENNSCTWAYIETAVSHGVNYYSLAFTFSNLGCSKAVKEKVAPESSGKIQEWWRITAVLKVDEVVNNALAFPFPVCRPDVVTGSWITRDQGSLAVTHSNMSTIHI